MLSACFPSAIVVLLAAAPGAAIHVEAGALTQAVEAAIAAEHGAARVASRREDAQLLLAAIPTPEGLAVEVRTREGAPIVARLVALERDAAVRVIVLLAGEALAAYEAPPGEARPTPIPADLPAPPPRAPPPEAAFEASADVAAGLLGMVWQHPASVHAGFWIAAHAVLDPLRAGGRAEVAGLPCCALETAQAEGDARIFRALLDAALDSVVAGPVTLSFTAALGVEVTSVDTRVLTFAGPSPVQTEAAVSPFARAGASLSFALSSRVRLVAAVGIEVRPARISIFLPPGYGDGSPVFDAGPITPSLSLGLEMAF